MHVFEEEKQWILQPCNIRNIKHQCSIGFAEKQAFPVCPIRISLEYILSAHEYLTRIHRNELNTES